MQSGPDSGSVDAPPDPVRRAHRLSVPGLLRLAGAVVCLAFAAGSLLVWSAHWFWLGEIAVSFTWQLGLAGCAGAALLALIGRAKLALVAFLLSGLHLGPTLFLWLPDERSGPLEQDGPELTVATCNLFWDNTGRNELLAWLESAAPDIVAFQEVSPFWLEVLEGLSNNYPYLLVSPPPERWSAKTCGTAFLSRVPISSGRLIPSPEEISQPLMEITTALAGESLVLRSAHPHRPGKAYRNAERDAVLLALAEQDWSGRSILLGDLNVTGASPSFGRLLETSGLRDSRAGFGRQPSWMTRTLLPGLWITIDHVLVSDSIHVLERRTDVLPGSDHLTVVARVTARVEASR